MKRQEAEPPKEEGSSSWASFLGNTALNITEKRVKEAEEAAQKAAEEAE